MRYRFGEFSIDTDLFELRRRGNLVKLTAKTFDLVLFLLEHRDRVVTRRELFERLWPNSVVSESSLDIRVSDARRAVGDNGSVQSVIETAKGRGYRFVASVESSSAELHPTRVPLPNPPFADVEPETPNPLKTPVQFGGERKTATVLVCRASEPQDDGAEERFAQERAQLAQVHEAARRFGGTVVPGLHRETTMLFGAPNATEDHGIRAVLAAALLTGQGFAAGVDTGAVLVGSVDGSAEGAIKVLGDTLELARAMSAAAPPREVYLGSATLERVRRRVRVEATPGRAGLEEGTYRLVAVEPLPTGLLWPHRGTTSPFVGRDNLLGMLRSLYDEARDGRGQVASVVGEAGMGKTRLLFELCGAIAQDDTDCLLGRSVSHAQSTPLAVALGVVRSRCGISRVDTSDVIEAKLRATSATLCGSTLNLMRDALTGQERSSAEEQSSDHLARRARLLEACLDLVLEAPLDKTTVLAIENLHWADPTSLEWLDLLAHRVSARRLLLICTMRPGPAVPWAHHSYSTQLTLPPLRDPDARAIVLANLSEAGELPGDDVDQVVERAQGNPLFLEELAGACGNLTERDQPGVPTSITSITQARIDRLDDRAKLVLQAAAFAGPEVDRRLLASVSSLSDKDLGSSLLQLSEAELLHDTNAQPGPAYSFRHALVRDAVCESMIAPARRDIHRRIAEAMEAADLVDQYLPERRAHHWSEAGVPRHAVPLWLEAAERAWIVSGGTEAGTHIEKALALTEDMSPGPDRDRFELDCMLSRGRVLLYTEGFGDELGVASYDRVVALACADANEFDRLKAMWGLLLNAWNTGFEPTVDAMECLQQETRDSCGSVSSVMMTFGTGQVYAQKGQIADSSAMFKRCSAIDEPGLDVLLCEVASFDVRLVASVQHAAVELMLGDVERALAIRRDAYRRLQETSHLYTRTSALISFVATGSVLYKPADLLLYSQEGAEMEQVVPVPFFSGIMAITERIARYRLGEDVSLREIERETERVIAGRMFACPMSWILFAVVELHLKAGSLDSARALHRHGVDLARRHRNLHLDPEMQRLDAEILWHGSMSERESSEPLLRSALDLADEQQNRFFALRAATSLARMLAESGRTDEALSLLAPHCARFPDSARLPAVTEAHAQLRRLQQS